MNWRDALKAFLIVPAVGLGLLAFRALDTGEAQMADAIEAPALPVRVETVRADDLRPAAIGYGRVEPARTWSAVPQVAGRLTTVADGLAEGLIVEEGQLLFEIDRRNYEIARDKAAANITSIDAQLAETDQREANTRASIAIEKRALELRRNEVERARQLVERGTSPASSLESAQQSLLQQEEAIQNLQNTLDLYDEQRASLEATRAVREAELEEAERSLADTRILAPFDGRVTEAEADADEYVRVGDRLATLEGVEASEVTAEFQPGDIAPVVQVSLGADLASGMRLDATDAITLLRRAGIEATVRRSVLGTAGDAWPAEIVRVRGSVDDAIGTIGITVRIDDPNLAVPGTRAPLNNGSFVEVDLAAATGGPVTSTSRGAVRTDDDGTGFLYVVDAEDRLARLAVTPGAVVGDRIIVAAVPAGTRVVLSDPQPAILGMPLAPVEDDGDPGTRVAPTDPDDVVPVASALGAAASVPGAAQ